MIKKILAVVLAAVLAALCFAACGKKPETEDLYGEDKPVAYNENGYAVYNDKGLVRIYDTDDKGNIIKDENGEPQYNYYDVGGSFVHDGILDTKDYAFKMPSGWDVGDNSVFTKRGTDGECKVTIVVASGSNEEVDFQAYTAEYDKNNEDAVNELKQQGNDASMETESFYLGQAQSPAFASTFIIKDADGKVSHYAVTIYYLYDAKIFQISYLCNGGVGYDESFDFLSYVKENYVTK